MKLMIYDGFLSGFPILISMSLMESMDPTVQNAGAERIRKHE